MVNTQDSTATKTPTKKRTDVMKVSGFTIARNVITYDYPIVESILSVLPFCDEFIVAVGNSDDDTLRLIKMIPSDKIKIIETVWDDTLREGGKVLADETDKALAAISPDSDWAFYLQADEVIHEDYTTAIQDALLKYKDDEKVDGLLFKYKHFYGSFDFVGDSRQWYRKEIRVIKNNRSISSYRDAQGFRKNGKKLCVKEVDAYIYHYGWVKPPAAQQAKQKHFHKMWHDDRWMLKHVSKEAEFDYSKIDSLAHFKGRHPAVMNARIADSNWKFSFDPTKKQLSLKLRILLYIQNKWGWKIGEYKNYKIC